MTSDRMYQLIHQQFSRFPSDTNSFVARFVLDQLWIDYNAMPEKVRRIRLYLLNTDEEWK